MGDKVVENKKKDNTVDAMRNWEQRIISEMESVHKWNDNWTELFDTGVPHDYKQRIEFLEKEVKK